MNWDHPAVFESSPKFCISNSFVDHESHSISSKGFLPTVLDINGHLNVYFSFCYSGKLSYTNIKMTVPLMSFCFILKTKGKHDKKRQAACSNHLKPRKLLVLCYKIQKEWCTLTAFYVFVYFTNSCLEIQMCKLFCHSLQKIKSVKTSKLRSKRIFRPRVSNIQVQWWSKKSK